MSAESKIETFCDYMDFYIKAKKELDEKIMLISDELPERVLAEIAFKCRETEIGCIAMQALAKRNPDLTRRILDLPRIKEEFQKGNFQ